MQGYSYSSSPGHRIPRALPREPLRLRVHTFDRAPWHSPCRWSEVPQLRYQIHPTTRPCRLLNRIGTSYAASVTSAHIRLYLTSVKLHPCSFSTGPTSLNMSTAALSSLLATVSLLAWSSTSPTAIFADRLPKLREPRRQWRERCG